MPLRSPRRPLGAPYIKGVGVSATSKQRPSEWLRIPGHLVQCMIQWSIGQERIELSMDTRNTTIHVRLTTDEYNALKELVTDEGCTISAPVKTEH